jgi:hypothetical protein
VNDDGAQGSKKRHGRWQQKGEPVAQKKRKAGPLGDAVAAALGAGAANRVRQEGEPPRSPGEVAADGDEEAASPDWEERAQRKPTRPSMRGKRELMGLAVSFPLPGGLPYMGPPPVRKATQASEQAPAKASESTRPAAGGGAAGGRGSPSVRGGRGRVGWGPAGRGTGGRGPAGRGAGGRGLSVSADVLARRMAGLEKARAIMAARRAAVRPVGVKPSGDGGDTSADIPAVGRLAGSSEAGLGPSTSSTRMAAAPAPMRSKRPSAEAASAAMHKSAQQGRRRKRLTGNQEEGRVPAAAAATPATSDPLKGKPRGRWAHTAAGANKAAAVLPGTHAVPENEARPASIPAMPVSPALGATLSAGPFVDPKPVFKGRWGKKRGAEWHATQEAVWRGKQGTHASTPAQDAAPAVDAAAGPSGTGMAPNTDAKDDPKTGSHLELLKQAAQCGAEAALAAALQEGGVLWTFQQQLLAKVRQELKHKATSTAAPP